MPWLLASSTTRGIGCEYCFGRGTISSTTNPRTGVVFWTCTLVKFFTLTVNFSKVLNFSSKCVSEPILKKLKQVSLILRAKVSLLLY